MLVVAMIATPMLATVSQAQKADHGNQRFKVCEKVSPAKNKQGADKAGNSGKLRREPRKCVPDVPPPPPVTDPGSGGSTGGSAVGIAEIHGAAFNDANGNGTWDDGEAPLSGQPIQLLGPVNQVVSTGADGSYVFAALPVGMYTVCSASSMSQMAPQTGPSCPNGSAGWSAEVPDVLPSIWYLDIDFGLR
jgi:hypothetical protein